MKPVKKILVKLLKITGITIGSILLLMFLLPILFPDFVGNKIKSWANSSIKGELNFSRARLSFFNHFPALTLTLYDVSLKGSAPFEKDTLLASKEVALGVDLSTLIEKKVSIDKIFLTGAFINIEADSTGQANYNVYAPAADTTHAVADSNNSASLKIEKILVQKSRMRYNDQSFPMLIDARGIYYEGTGDLSKAIFDLHTHTEIDSVDFTYNGRAFFQNKKVNADLITRINTSSLEFRFEKNNLKINSLPVEFNGRFAFLKNGYDMDFKMASAETDLHNVFTALPPLVLKWLDSTDVRGFGDISATLKGRYYAKDSTAPDLSFKMKIRDGYIANKNAPSPVKNLYLNLETRLPGLDPDSLYLNIDSVFFNIDKDYFSSILRVKGLQRPQIYTKTNGDIDLEKWDRAFGVQPFDVKGRYAIHLDAEGTYATSVVQKGLRKKDTIITSIPHFNFRSSLSNGYFKYASLPQPVTNISFNLNASCPDSNYKHTSLAFENFNANVLSNYIKGFFKLSNAADFPVDASIRSVFHLSDIKKFYPLDSMDLSGDLDVNIQTKGNYLPAKKLFPITHALFQLKDASVQTKYYPHPIEKIQVSANVTSSKGSLTDLNVAVTPVSFLFEGQPFLLKADLKNFSDLKYNVTSKGVIDIGKIYQVFAKKGYDVKGFIQADIALSGKQSDATTGHYERLNNAGTLKVKDIVLSSDLFPQPFYISNGQFRFDQDKMWFDQFVATYGKTSLNMKGYLTNVINYATIPNAPLKGSFDFNSNLVLVDEFMAYAGDTSKATSTGVVIIPSNLSIALNADAKTVQYNGINLKDFKGQVVIDSGILKLNQTGFNLVDAPVVMDARYKSLNPKRAQFSYHIDAKEFDIKKAYNQIKLFHDMATAAANAEGIVSLDYELDGKLDDNMHPVYPSLKGGGVLSLKKVKVKGFKLFGEVSKESGHDINDPDLSKVDIKTTINNNIITIQRTRMKVSGFRPRFEGQVSFDGQLNLKFRLGLPPFGIFGIPMTVTGTQANPHVRLGHGKKKDELKETEDKDEEEAKQE